MHRMEPFVREYDIILSICWGYMIRNDLHFIDTHANVMIMQMIRYKILGGIHIHAKHNIYHRPTKWNLWRNVHKLAESIIFKAIVIYVRWMIKNDGDFGLWYILPKLWACNYSMKSAFFFICILIYVTYMLNMKTKFIS